MPAGPTVTASGRQVRSRATGLYGETLLSGQVSDRASPATGDYVRSDASEEPHQPHAHGRATRNAPRGTTNGRPLKHSLESDDEDATSWDGGDEDEDEPEQMELDDDEDDDADDSSEDEELQSLVVTLRYGKGSSNPSNGTTTFKEVLPDAVKSNGIDANGSSHPGVADPVAPQQPEQQPPAPMEPSIQPAPPPQPVAAFGLDRTVVTAPVPNVIPTIPQQPSPAPVPQAAVLPKLDGMFPAQQPVQYATGQSVPFAEQKPQQPTLPSPTPAANWQ